MLSKISPEPATGQNKLRLPRCNYPQLNMGSAPDPEPLLYEPSAMRRATSVMVRMSLSCARLGHVSGVASRASQHPTRGGARHPSRSIGGQPQPAACDKPLSVDRAQVDHQGRREWISFWPLPKQPRIARSGPPSRRAEQQAGHDSPDAIMHEVFHVFANAGPVAEIVMLA